MKRKSFLFLISLIFGILFCYFLKEKNLKIFIIFTLSFVTVVSIVLKLNKKFNYFLVFFLLGFIITFFNTKQSILKNYFDENVNIVADVFSVNKTENSNKYEIYIKSVDDISLEEKSILYTDANLNIADRIFLTGKIREIKQNTNPRLFNFKKFNLKNKIYTKIYSEKVKILSKSDDVFLNIKEKLNSYIKNVFDKTLSEKNSNIVKRIFLSSKFDIDFDKDVNEIGISHILCVSGLHIGIIYILINKLFTYIYIKRIFREILSLFFIFLYVSFISNPSSAIRAEIFLSTLLITKYFCKINDSLNALFVTCLIILMKNPFMLFDIGLILSFLSVFSIIYILQYFKEKKDGIVNRLFKISLSVLIITLPVILYVFGKISIFVFLANIVLVPIFIFVIICSFILLLLSIISIKLTIVLAVIIDFILDVLRFNIEFLKDISVRINFYNFTIALAILYYFSVFILIKRRIFKKLSYDYKKYLQIAIFTMIISISFFNLYKDETKINFIDIGQGDSALIRTNSKNILIDTGGIAFGKGNNGKTTLIPYLKKQGVNKLDYVFISHLDADHCKNLKLLCENIKVKNIVFRKNGYKDYLKKYGKINAKKIIDIQSNENIIIDNLSLDIYQVINSLSENDKSIVINLKTHNKKILFTGDIGLFTENQLLKKNISADYLKVAHHGSKYSNTEEFLKKVNPKVAVISCGYKNRYNHPHKEAIFRIQNVTKNIYRTDLDGNVILKINNCKEKITSFNKIHENLLESIYFYFEDIIFITFYLFSFMILILIRRNYGLYSSVENIR